MADKLNSKSCVKKAVTEQDQTIVLLAVICLMFSNDQEANKKDNKGLLIGISHESLLLNP